MNVLCEKTEAGRPVAALGIVVLCWLSVRTFSRLRRLGKARGRLKS